MKISEHDKKEIVDLLIWKENLKKRLDKEKQECYNNSIKREEERELKCIE